MDLIEGETLGERLKAGAIPVEDSMRIAQEIAAALEYISPLFAFLIPTPGFAAPKRRFAQRATNDARGHETA